MDALRIGGAAELARSLIFRCWVRLRRHRGNLAPRWLDEIGEASFYAVLVEGVEAPEEEVSRALQRLGHRIGRRWLREARCILRGSLSNAWRPHDFPPTPEGRRNLVLMGLEFLRYLCLSRGLAPLQADALRQLVVRYLLETARPTDPSLLLFEEYRLEACLSAWTNGLPPLGSRGFALLAGLELAAAAGCRRLEVRADSQLVIRQLNGRYRVKNRRLIPLVLRVKQLAARFEQVTFTHVPREENQLADRLANRAIDEAAS